MVVPGSGLVKEQAEQEGLDKIFINSGFEWREPGCSMSYMNADKLKPRRDVHHQIEILKEDKEEVEGPI